MNSNRFWAAGKTLAVVTVILVMMALLSPSADAQTYKVLYNFTGGDDGGVPVGVLTFDATDNLYGTTWAGGDSACPITYGYAGCGVVFELMPNLDGTWTQTVLHTFHGSDGAGPQGRLSLDAAGTLYGSAKYGGKTTRPCAGTGCGIVFTLTPNLDGSWTQTVLHAFSWKDGSGPNHGVLLSDGAGNLYGVTDTGSNSSCPNGCGVIYELSPNSDGTWTETVLHSFDRPGGVFPEAGLTFDADGTLYGAAQLNGANGLDCGTVYKLTPTSTGGWKYRVIHPFAAHPSCVPETGVTLDPEHNLYGTTIGTGGHSGWGTVFQMTPKPTGGWAYRVIHKFTGGHDGGRPGYAPLILDAAGNLYGTTTAGGPHDAGNVFELVRTSSGWKEQVLYSFTGGVDGGGPLAGLIFDTSGNLYGTTTTGGANGAGVIFEITP